MRRKFVLFRLRALYYTVQRESNPACGVCEYPVYIRYINRNSAHRQVPHKTRRWSACSKGRVLMQAQIQTLIMRLTAKRLTARPKRLSMVGVLRPLMRESVPRMGALPVKPSRRVAGLPREAMAAA